MVQDPQTTPNFRLRVDICISHLALTYCLNFNVNWVNVFRFVTTEQNHVLPLCSEIHIEIIYTTKQRPL